MDKQESIDSAVMKLESTMQDVDTDLADVPDLYARVKNVMTTLINGLKFSSGGLGSSPAIPAQEEKPLTHFLGRKIEERKPRPISEKNPTIGDVENLRTKAIKLYKAMDDMKSSEILEHEQENTIRAVAKLSGMSVTPDDPETIDIPFIDSIREAKKEKQKLDAEAKKGKGAKNQLADES